MHSEICDLYDEIQREQGITPTRPLYGDNRCKLYDTWRNMNRRCHDENNKDYRNYGQRGVAVCDEWRGSYRAFEVWALKNGYDPSLSGAEQQLERIDNSKGYSPRNCTFKTAREQARNRRTNRHVMYGNEEYLMCDLAEQLGVDSATLSWRIADGWPQERWGEGNCKNRQVTIDGVTFESVTAMAEYVGITEAAMRKRLKSWPESRWLEPCSR